jgi:hypothetical protein
MKSFKLTSKEGNRLNSVSYILLELLIFRLKSPLKMGNLKLDVLITVKSLNTLNSFHFSSIRQFLSHTQRISQEGTMTNLIKAFLIVGIFLVSITQTYADDLGKAWTCKYTLLTVEMKQKWIPENSYYYKIVYANPLKGVGETRDLALADIRNKRKVIVDSVKKERSDVGFYDAIDYTSFTSFSDHLLYTINLAEYADQICQERESIN